MKNTLLAAALSLTATTTAFAGADAVAPGVVTITTAITLPQGSSQDANAGVPTFFSINRSTGRVVFTLKGRG
jgi:hypothetical protein